ncbi:MAG TPA: rod shape-determining protein MreD [Acidiphilium sp.]|uniref:rod shape-determining protein MreD n=1 Tax=unclassified Acidiphilium TaxID=2617493 RepID=UPI000BDAF771|nr:MULTISPECIES: rod shape-determining protein MreD [unclassified Acidiphilium]OYV55970.1 MAG: rod shape-determining protein MreD [Acidiphilium sp. 20-67-58]HQT61552.1 rod shape-determining protein MreD [Acidiphilium sp.]HQU09982.1 rod shape-determining protein MreD [Acidiphilium sp.]
MMDLAEVMRALDRAARATLPTAVIVVVVVLLALPGLFPAASDVRAGFVMSSVFFWTIYRPAALPAPVVALIGVLLGLIGDVPLGVWSVLLLLEQAVAGMSRRILLRQGFMVIWLAFAGCALAVVTLEWLARMLLTFSTLPVLPTVLEFVTCVLIYPLVVVPLARAHAGPAAPEQA